MRIRKVVRRLIDERHDGANVAGGLNAVVAANVNEPGRSRTRVSSRQRIVQRNGRTEVHEEVHETESTEDDEPTTDRPT